MKSDSQENTGLAQEGRQDQLSIDTNPTRHLRYFKISNI